MSIGMCFWIASSTPVFAQASPDMRGGTGVSLLKRSNENDCNSNQVQFKDDPTLTREEKIAKMDEALGASLDRYDACQTELKNSTASGGGGGGGGNAGGGASQTTSDMRGTDPDPVAQPLPAGGVVATENANLSSGGNDDSQPGPPALKNGKLPEDIPPADNDSVLEAQIREAALNETDPVIQKKLWNEYRKYKGLPPAK
tara:strand:+ start:3782 stop:4381 length:600 start_codon:yes stop_codon:yes gene_type:complete